jgi:hypothetical protein
MTIANNMKVVPVIKGDKQESMTNGLAFFNQTYKDFQRAKNGFIRRFGLKKWEESGIDKLHDTGIMAIFDGKPTTERLWFVETIAFLVNERICTQKGE